MPRTPYFPATPSVSGRIKYFIPWRTANSLAVAGSFSTLMPAKTTFLSLYFSCNLPTAGLALRQGGHHDAQKYKNTGFPRLAESENGLPSVSLSLKSGAAAGVAASVIPTENKAIAAVTDIFPANRL